MKIFKIELDNGKSYKIEVDDSQQNQQPDSMLNRTADAVSGAMKFINNPGGQDMSGVNTMELKGPELFNKIGGNVAEYLGGAGVNDYLSAGIGTAVSMANPQNWLTPAPRAVSGKVFEPTIPAGRQAAVQAAKDAGVPLSRAEQTGGRFLSGLENFTEKTPMGGIPMGDARAEGDLAMQAYKERLQTQMGTPKENFDVGYEAKPGMEARDAAMQGKRQQMFDAIPTDPYIPLNESIGVADQILLEQKDYLPTTRNPDVISIAKDVQNAHRGISSGEGVTGGEHFGHTYKTPDTVIPEQRTPGSVKYVEESGNYDPSKPVQRGYDPSYYRREQAPDNVTPGKTIPGEPVFEGGYKASPETKFEPKSNYQLLKRLRETLDGKARAARESKNFTSERDYLRLKSAVDKDIQAYVETSGDTAFASSYKQANAFSGAYKRLFKGDLASKIEGAPPEKVIGMVFQKNNETAIKQFRALVGDEAFQAAKKKWVNDILESPDVSKALSEQKVDPGTLNAILSKPEQEALSQYGSVQGLRKTVGNVPGTQGSARINTHAASYGAGLTGLYEALKGDWQGAAAFGAAFLGPYPVGKTLASNAFRNGVDVSISGSLKNAAMAAFVSRIITKDPQ